MAENLGILHSDSSRKSATVGKRKALSEHKFNKWLNSCHSRSSKPMRKA
jgi:hypothetical protein